MEIRIPAFFRGWVTDPPPPAVLLGGEGAGLSEMVAELFLDRLGRDGGAAELFRLGTMDMERESPVPEWRTPSLFCRFRVYLLPEYGELRKDPRTELLAYLASPDPNVVLVLPCADRNAMKKLSAIPGIRASTLREEQTDRILGEYCEGRAADAGKEMPEEVALFLVRWTGGDFSRIRSEMGKLLAYAGERGRIGEEEIRQVCIAGGSVDPFRMADDLIHGRRDACIGQFRRFARSAASSDYHALVGAMAWTVRNRTAGQKGSRGTPVRPERAGAVLTALASIDAGLKGGSGLSPEQLFEIRMLALLA
jgi:DNA polymerase III delta subunit